jgi:hypothetical protein
VAGDAGAAAAALQRQLHTAWGKAETAATPAAMQLTLQALLLCGSIQQVCPAAENEEQQQQQQQQDGQQQLVNCCAEYKPSELLTLLCMQQFAAYLACDEDPAAFSSWPWQGYQAELLLLQTTLPHDSAQAGLAAAAVVHQLCNETPCKFVTELTHPLILFCVFSIFFPMTWQQHSSSNAGSLSFCAWAYACRLSLLVAATCNLP